MRIKNWLGAGTLASAACLLAACYGGDPSAMTEAELAGYGMPGLSGGPNLAVTPAVDLSKGAACVQAIRALDLECPGLSHNEVSALRAAIQPTLMRLPGLIRVTLIRTGGQVFARIDGGEDHADAFESVFGTNTLVVPVQADGSFQITVPVAETEGRFGRMGYGGFGMQQPMLGGLGRFGGLGQGWGGYGSPMGGIGGGPSLGFGGMQPGLTGQLGMGGLLGRTGWGGSSLFSQPFGGASACPCPGAVPQVTYTAYGVEARLRGHVDLANVQFAPDATGQTETAILDRNELMQMEGEIALVPIAPGLGGEQAVPPMGVRSAHPRQAGVLGGQLGGAYTGGFGTPHAGILGGQLGGQVIQSGPQAACPVQVTAAEPPVEVRIPLQMCTACGVDTGAADPTIVTAPNIPEPTCPQLIVRPVQAPCPCE